MDKSSLIRRIKGLRQMGSSDNPNESAQAIAIAQRLMEKNGITEGELLISEMEEAKAFACKARKTPLYISILSDMVGDVFGVATYWVTTPQNDTSAVFVGQSPQVEIAQYCFSVLVRKLKASRANYIRENSYRWRKRASKTKAGDYYAIGWVSALREKVFTLVPAREIPTHAQKAVTEIVGDGSIMKVKTPKAGQPSRSDLSAYQSGTIDGDKESIHIGVDHVPAPKQLT